MPATVALRLAGLAALVGGGVAVGRGVVGMSNGRPDAVEIASASAAVSPEFASPPVSASAPAAAGDIQASSPPPSAAIQAASAPPSADVQAASALPSGDIQSASPASASPPSSPAQAEPVFTSTLRSWAAAPSAASPPIVDAAALSASASVAPTPTAPAEPSTYTVTAGDTLSQIAARFGVDTGALVQANRLVDPNVLVPGTSLAIPVVGAQAAAMAPVRQAAPPAPAVAVQMPAPASATIQAPASVVVGAASPDDAVRSFYGYLDQGRFDEAAGLWSQHMRSAYPPAENIYSRFARTQALTLTRADVVQLDAASGRATVAVCLSEVVGPPTSTRQYVGNWYLVRGATGWLLDQPSLQAE